MSKKDKSICAKLIANPGSGTTSRRGALLERVTRCLQEQGIEVDVAVAKPKEEAIPIARRAMLDAGSRSTARSRNSNASVVFPRRQ